MKSVKSVEYDGSLDHFVLKGNMERDVTGDIEQAVQSTPWIDHAWVDADVPDTCTVKLSTTSGFNALSDQRRHGIFLDVIDSALQCFDQNREQTALVFCAKPQHKLYI